MDAHRINAIATPAPSVFPRRGFLGVLTLDTRFPRLPGDIGNPASFGFPALTRVVRGARPDQAVQSAAAQRAADLFAPFCAAMRDLESMGASAITTSCGFLVLLQDRLQAAAKVPVVTSSLLFLPELLASRPRVGVLTISAQHLGEEFLAAAGVPEARMRDVIVEGVAPDGEFARTFLGNRSVLDVVQARRDVVDAARRLCAREPSLTDIVLECTNMPPFAGAVVQATGLRCRSLLQSERLAASCGGTRSTVA